MTTPYSQPDPPSRPATTDPLAQFRNQQNLRQPVASDTPPGVSGAAQAGAEAESRAAWMLRRSKELQEADKDLRLMREGILPEPEKIAPARAAPQRSVRGAVGAFVGSGVNAALMGAGPNISGALRGAAAMIPGGQSPREAYIQGTQQAKDRLEQLQHDNPEAAMAGTGAGVVGSMVGPMALARTGAATAGAVRHVASRGAATRAAATEGAAWGGGSGLLSGVAGSDPNDPLYEQFKDALKGTVLHAAVGTAAGAAIHRAVTGVPLSQVPGAGRVPLMAERRGAAQLVDDALMTGVDLGESAAIHAQLTPALREITPVAAVVEPAFASRFFEASRNRPSFTRQVEKAADNLDDYRRAVGAEKDAFTLTTRPGETIAKTSPRIDDPEFTKFITQQAMEVPAFGRVVDMTKRLTNDAGQGFSVGGQQTFRGTMAEFRALNVPRDRLPADVAHKLDTRNNIVAEAQAKFNNLMGRNVDFVAEVPFQGSVVDLANRGVPLEEIPAGVRPLVERIRGGRVSPDVMQQYQRTPVPEFTHRVPFQGTLTDARTQFRPEHLPANIRGMIDGGENTIHRARERLATVDRAPMKDFEYDMPFTPNALFVDNLRKVARSESSKLYEGLDGQAGNQVQHILNDLTERMGAMPQFGQEFLDVNRRYAEVLRVGDQLSINTGVRPMREGLFPGMTMRAGRLQPVGNIGTPAARGIVDVVDPGGSLFPSAAGRAGFGIDLTKKVFHRFRRAATDEIGRQFLKSGDQALQLIDGVRAATEGVKSAIPITGLGASAGVTATQVGGAVRSNRKKDDEDED